jgi:hypothetical protein
LLRIPKRAGQRSHEALRPESYQQTGLPYKKHIGKDNHPMTK